MILPNQRGKKWSFLVGFLVVSALAAVRSQDLSGAKTLSDRAGGRPRAGAFLPEPFLSLKIPAVRVCMPSISMNTWTRSSARIKPILKEFWLWPDGPPTNLQPRIPFRIIRPGTARSFSDRIRRGKTGGFCAQYAFVFGEACLSAGYIPRYLDLASPENPGGHFTTEVYVPSLKKWVVFEAEWGFYYVDAHGNPLSALDLHDWATGVRKDPYREVPIQVHHEPFLGASLLLFPVLPEK